MTAIIGDWTTSIRPAAEEVNEMCRPGAGADTCAWLVCGAGGFECTYYNKPWALVDRFKRGETAAKRDGCEKVKAFSPLGLGGEVEF